MTEPKSVLSLLCRHFILAVFALDLLIIWPLIYALDWAMGRERVMGSPRELLGELYDC